MIFKERKINGKLYSVVRLVSSQYYPRSAIELCTDNFIIAAFYSLEIFIMSVFSKAICLNFNFVFNLFEFFRIEFHEGSEPNLIN